LIGFGHWGRNLARNLHGLGVLRGVCDTRSERRQAALKSYPEIDSHPNVEAVLTDDAIDCLVVATPAVTHFEISQLALEAGKDVLVEKPLALRTEEGERLVDLADRNRRVLMVGHVLRYHPAVVELRRLVATGELGSLRYLYSNRLNMGRIRTEENSLWSFAPHDISVMLALLGSEPLSCSCRGSAYVNSEVADVTLSDLDFSDGVHAHIFVSWLHPFKEQRLVVIGSEKMAVFDEAAADKLVLYPHRVEWTERVPSAVKQAGQPVEIGKIEPLRAECEHFVDCVLRRATPITDGQEGLRVLKVLDRLQKSLERGGLGVFREN
jgi:UDP-2-acetamido-3-amino-2,3-dideoxy-glucuronate N-acetyltransferase